MTEEASLRGKNKSTKDKASNECPREVREQPPLGNWIRLLEASQSLKSTALKKETSEGKVVRSEGSVGRIWFPELAQGD